MSKTLPYLINAWSLCSDLLLHSVFHFLPPPPIFFIVSFLLWPPGQSFCPNLHLKPSSVSLLPCDHLDPCQGQTLPGDSPETEAMQLIYHFPPTILPRLSPLFIHTHSCLSSFMLSLLAPPSLCLASNFLAFWWSFITGETLTVMKTQACFSCKKSKPMLCLRTKQELLIVVKNTYRICFTCNAFYDGTQLRRKWKGKCMN